MENLTSPIDVVLNQIGVPNGMRIRTCPDHGKFMIPRDGKFTCPMCASLHDTPNGTPQYTGHLHSNGTTTMDVDAGKGNGDTAGINDIKSGMINNLKHFIQLGC